jgi:hypothetical protein
MQTDRNGNANETQTKRKRNANEMIPVANAKRKTLNAEREAVRSIQTERLVT